MEAVIAFVDEFGVIAQRTADGCQRKRGLGGRTQPTSGAKRAAAIHFFGQVERMFSNVQHDDGHPVFGQRAGFIGADDRDRAERFDGGKFADECLTFQHALRAERERDGDDGGQAFGHDGDGNADRGQQHVADFIAAPNADDKNQRSNDHANKGEFFSKRVETTLKRSLFFFDALDHVRDFAEFGVHARGDDECESAPLGDDRAHVGHVATVAQRKVFIGKRDGMFFNRFRLTRQRGFLNPQVDCFK